MLFTHKNIFIPPLAITKFKVIPIKFLEKKSARAGFGPDRSGPGLQGTVDSFVGISILCRDTVSFNLIYICVL